MKKALIAFLVIMIVGISNIQAIYVSPRIELLYNKFYSKIENKYSKTRQLSVLNGLAIKLEQFKNLKKYKNNSKIQGIINQFLYLNENKIISLTQTSFDGKEVDINLGNKNIYDKVFEGEKKRRKKIIDSYNYSKYFKNISYTKSNIFLEKGVWYTYNFKSYSYFPDNSNIGLDDLKYNGIDVNKALLFVKNDNKLAFVKNPQKVRLISDNIISDIKNKYYLLEEIKDDLRIKSDINYDKEFIKLKNKARQLTGNIDKNTKIANIYNYILKNTKYSSIIDFSNYKIFSGIETYLNNDGICEGYAKLMTYMLMFSGVNDVKVIRGYVIDTQDFPDVGHAWIKVGNKYYDPTFDDPIGAQNDKNIRDYKYFYMPKDIFYTNRFDRKHLPKNIKNQSMQYRKDLVQKNLYDLYDKYKNSDYKLLRLIKLKKQNNISYNTEIGINNFNKILPLKVVSNFKFTENGIEKKITKLKYFELDGQNIENLLEQLDYNLDGKYFFLWYDKNGNSSYRLGYDVGIR